MVNLVGQYTVNEDLFVWHEVDPHAHHIEFFWKNDNGQALGSIQNLKKHLSQRGDSLVFAMNGGMYLRDQTPQGLFVQDGEILNQIDTNTIGYGNFYMQPNGIFQISHSGHASVVISQEYSASDSVKFATQSGPMLLIDGEYHPKFKKGSNNLHFRNGVGILPNGNIIFCLSKRRVNFYDFATFFKQIGCENALYLDGFVSRMYLPAKKWSQLDGEFGVIIGEYK